jgi:hypothetical protein
MSSNRPFPFKVNFNSIKGKTEEVSRSPGIQKAGTLALKMPANNF